MEPGELRPLSDSQREALAEAVRTYEQGLAADLEAQDYLDARGITEEGAHTYRLGVVSTPLPGHERFRGWLAIPYLLHDDEPRSIRFRCIEDHNHREHYHGKYMSLPDEPARVFNVRAVNRADDIIHLTEGELDAVILGQLGYDAVAIPGASGFQPHHRRLLMGFSKVYVWGDPDDAGADFVNRVTRALPRASAVRLREGDVTETYLAGGERAISQLIN